MNGTSLIVRVAILKANLAALTSIGILKVVEVGKTKKEAETGADSNAGCMGQETQTMQGNQEMT